MGVTRGAVQSLLIYLAVMIPLIHGMALPEDDWYDRMQVDPGYTSDEEVGYGSLSKPGKGCGGKPADIYFVLDASDNVGKNGFQRALEYVNDLVPSFAEDRTRIGVITFSDRVYSMIHLGQYSDHSKIQAAVKRIPFQGGQPNTGDALRYLWRKAFVPGIARREVAHIAIVITNGYSRNTKAVIQEARNAQNTGMYMYAVYPSESADPDELQAIASHPVDDFLFSMDTYNVLIYTENLLGSQLCEIQVDPTDTSNGGVCDTRRPADIVFAVDYATIGVKKAKKVLKFVKQSVSMLDIGSDRIHVGVLTNDCPRELDIDLGDHYTSDGVQEDLEAMEMPSQAELLKKARRRSFSRFYGARVDVQQTLVLFVDDKLDNPTRVAQEAMRTKARKIQIIVVAIGSRLDLKNLQKLATGEDSVIQVNSYDDLSKSREDIFSVICRGL